jgi:hypothetical protein
MTPAPITRRAIALTALYVIVALAGVTWSAAHQGGWLVFSWLDLARIALGLGVVPCAAALWLAWALLRRMGGRHAVAWLTAVGLALPLAPWAAMSARSQLARSRHEHQLAVARVESIADEPLADSTGRAIGVRLTFRIRYPEGLSAMGSQPPADSPMPDLSVPWETSVLVDFVTRRLEPLAAGDLPPGVTTFTADCVPAFMPLAIQQPGAFAPGDSANWCLRWRDDAQRERALAAEAQPLAIAIGPYGRYVAPGTRTTSRSYRLAEFHESARALGARECAGR